MTVLHAPCFWALLIPEQFRFAYLPDSVAQIVVGDDRQSVRDLLQDRSLLDFIHPEELKVAQADLERFLRVRTLAGSITRCRLLSFDYVSGGQNARRTPTFSTRVLASPLNYNNDLKCDHPSVDVASSSVEAPCAGFKPFNNDQWQVMDIVLYIVTENILLAFFHNTEHAYIQYTDRLVCGDCEPKQFEIDLLLDLLDGREQITRNGPYISLSAPQNLRVFQIHNGKTGKLIVSWPTCTNITTNDEASEISSTVHQKRHKTMMDEILCTTRNVMEKEILLLKSMTSNQYYKLQYHKAACTHPYRSSSMVRLSDGMYRFEHIIIPYGYITFGAFQVTMIAPTTISTSYYTSSNCTNTTRNSTYRHYIHYNAPEESRKNDIVSNSSDIGDTPPFIDDVGHRNDGRRNRTNISPHSSSRSKESESSLVALRQTSRHFNDTSSSITMVHGIRDRNNSQLYMSINRLLCSQTCESVELEQAVDRQVPTHYTYTHFPRGISVRICTKCHTSKSPEWRRGPSGDKTLCNACGLRFSRLVAKQRRMSSIQRR